MSSEIPKSIIRDLRRDIRRDAGVEYDDSSFPEIPSLPSIPEAVASLVDPALPSYLRCQRCRAGLLRGVHSIICAFCGAEQRRREGFTHSISFKDTVACRGFLKALDLDGSEIISLETSKNKSRKGQDSPKEKMTLSDLLDLEISWPPAKKEPEIIRTDKKPSQNTYALNLSGVDLDSFFTDPKLEIHSTPIVSDNQLILDKQNIGKETHNNSGSEIFRFPNNAQSLDRGVSSVEEREELNNFTHWEADFHSISSEPVITGKSADLFQELSGPESSSTPKAVAISEHLTNVASTGSVEGHNQDDAWEDMKKAAGNIESGKGEPKVNLDNMSYVSDSWTLDESLLTLNTEEPIKTEILVENDELFDEWQDFTSSVKESGTSEYSETQISVKNVVNKDLAEENPVNVQCNSKVPEDLWLPGDIVDPSKTGNMGNHDDSLDEWQGFTNSSNVHLGPSNLQTQTVARATTTTNEISSVSNTFVPEEKSDAHEKRWFISGNMEANRPQDTEKDNVAFDEWQEFTSVMNDKNLQGSADDRKDSTEMNNNKRSDVTCSESYERMTELHKNIDLDDTFPGAAESDGTSASGSTQNTANAKVEMLLAQMPNLSFMLKNELSFPKETESSDPKS